VPSEPPIMRSGNPAERPTIQLTNDDYLAATRPLAPTDDGPVGRTPTSRRLLDPRTLIDELWRISHFGWIPEAAIQRRPHARRRARDPQRQPAPRPTPAARTRIPGAPRQRRRDRGASLAAHRHRPTRPLQLSTTQQQHARPPSRAGASVPDHGSEPPRTTRAPWRAHATPLGIAERLTDE
jgi:hypothetical protein